MKSQMCLFLILLQDENKTAEFLIQKEKSKSYRKMSN